MADLIQFVDGPTVSATVRLDLNDDDGALHVRNVDWSPARLSRVQVSNMLSDGGYVGPSSYGLRTLVLDMDLLQTTQDAWAGSYQALKRELDRATNWLMFKPTGATFPVFFKTYRSDVASLEEVYSAAAFRQASVEVIAEPFAYGERETITVGTVNNDPAAGSNGCYFDVAGIKGDVAAPMVLVDTGTVTTDMVLAVKQDPLSSDFPVVFQAESMTLESADTTNPGGGPDAAMSGSGTNNYVRTSFTTTTADALRLTAVGSTDAEKKAMRGLHRAWLTARRSDNTSTLKVHTSRVVNDATVNGYTVETPLTTNRHLLDLGLVSIGLGDAINDDMVPTTSVALYASRSSGSGQLQYDCLQFVPADVATCLLSGLSAGFTSNDIVFDGERRQVLAVTSGTAIFSGGTVERRRTKYAGAIPTLAPGVTNRFFYIKYESATPLIDKTVTGSVTIYYHPRYDMVKPLAS